MSNAEAEKQRRAMSVLVIAAVQASHSAAASVEAATGADLSSAAEGPP